MFWAYVALLRLEFLQNLVGRGVQNAPFSGWGPKMAKNARDVDSAVKRGLSQQTHLHTKTSLKARQMSISQLIEKEIIPRLLTTHATLNLKKDFFQGRRVKAYEVTRFSELPLTNEADFLLAEIKKLKADGVSTESIFVDLLAASANKLGRMWENDECDFIDVTMGVGRLNEVMREFSLQAIREQNGRTHLNTALFTPFPGDQHNFGALVVEEIFANAGWATEALLTPKRQELLHIIAHKNFSLVGLTISCDYPSGTIVQLITAIRSVSKNPDVCVLVGGRFINENPEMAVKLGADGTATDARSALDLANSLIVSSEQFDIAVT